MTTRVNNLAIANNGSSFSFDGGICDCAIVKLTNESGGATGVTYGGQAMTLLGTVKDTAAPNNWFHQIWGLQGAPQGIVSVVLTVFSTTISSVESYSGISASAIFPNASNSDEHHLGSGSQTSIQVDVTTTVDDCILVGLGGYRAGSITFMTAGSDTTTISRNPPTGGDDLSFESNPLDVGLAGVYHLAGATGGGNTNFSISLVVVALAPGPAATPSFIPQIIVI